MKKLLIALTFLLAPALAHASLVPVDLFAPGDQLLTRDTETHFDWLDLTLTANQSVNDVLGGSGGWLAQGLKIADLNQVAKLFFDAGAIQLGAFPIQEQFDAAVNFLLLVGCPPFSVCPFPVNYIAVNGWASSENPLSPGAVAETVVEIALGTSADFNANPVTVFWLDPSSRVPNGGVWLVRPIPEASTLSLFFVGLAAALALYQKNRRDR